jgi:hypothetical protein
MGDFGSIKQADGSHLKVSGMGAVKLGPITINKVGLVRGLAHRLVSMSQLADLGYTFTLDSQEARILWEGQAILKIPLDRVGGLYKTEMTHVDQTVLIAAESDSKPIVATLTEWHNRLGHVNHARVKELIDKNLVDGAALSNKTVEQCDTCITAKATVKKHAKDAKRSAEYAGEMVCADLIIMGTNDQGVHNETAALVIVDRFTRYTAVYPLLGKNGEFIAQKIAHFVNRIASISSKPNSYPAHRSRTGVQ